MELEDYMYSEKKIQIYFDHYLKMIKVELYLSFSLVMGSFGAGPNVHQY